LGLPISIDQDWWQIARRARPGLVVAACCLAAYLGGTWAAGALLGRNQEWDKDRVERGHALGAPDLFRELFESGAARFDRAQFRIELPPADCADRLRVDKNEPSCRGRPEELFRLTQRLHHTAAGRAVREEVVRWNQAFGIIAVRDDRARGEPCAGELDEAAARLSAFIVPRGCRPAQWSAFLGMTALGGDEAGRIDVSHRTAAEPSPAVFGFIAAERIAEFGDWLAIDAARMADARIELESRVAPPPPPARGAPRLTPPRELRIDVIGTVEAVTIDGERLAAADLAREGAVPTRRTPGPASRTPGAATVGREQLCLDAGRLRVPRCTARILREGSPHATRLRIPAAARPGSRRIVIEARPVRSIPARLRLALQAPFCGVASPEREDGAVHKDRLNPPAGGPCAPRERLHEGLRQRITESLVFWCRGPAEGDIVRIDARAQCFLHFESVERTSQPAEPSLAITAADRTRLVETVRDARDGRARVEVRPETLDLGLLPVVGIGDGDYLSLAGQLAARSRSGRPVTAGLTIDPAWQRIVKEEVETRLVPSAGQRTQAPASGLLEGRRRAAIVIIDADSSPGDILAIATWPALGRGEKLADWDLRALEAWNPPDSPLAALGWAQNNFLTVPGSAFKPVTALAALQRAIDGDAAVRQAIMGFTSEADLERGMALRFANDAYQPAPPHPLAIRNFQGDGRVRGRVGDAFRPPARTGCPSLGGGPQIGLCEALLKSNNVWFARLADMTDYAALRDVPAGTRATRINMADIVTRLYPAQRFPLAELPDIRLSASARTSASPIVLDAIAAPVRGLNRRITLAFNGIGQQVQTTPTALAAIYAGVGTGRVVRPRIVKGPPPAPGALILRNVDERTQDQWLQYLRLGLKAVVGSPEGTASGAFRNAADIRPFLFAKTGTATVQDGDDRRTVSSTLGHTVWLAGYFDPAAADAGQRAPIGRRFAFACMVTHARGGTGGALCAPAMERVLRRLAAIGTASR
jgi:cell division protein FtsI/penicillin-binding protein 2